MAGSSFGAGMGQWTGNTSGSSRVASVIMLLTFSLFWCCITGVFVGFLGTMLYRVVDARRRFVPVAATVTASRVAESRGSKGGTNYAPVVEYTYTVAGRTYRSDRHDFMPVSSGGARGRSAAAAVVARCSPGTIITVYHDPQRPETATISRELPDMLVFLALFLQPFLLVGIGMMAATVLAVRDAVQARDFRNGSARRLPWPIPGWGILRHEPGGISVLRGGGRAIAVALAFAVGYGATCFVSVFVLMFGFLLLLEGRYGLVGPALAAFALAPVVGAIAAICVWRKGAPTVTFTIDAMRGMLTLAGGPHRPALNLRLNDVAALRVLTVDNETRFKQKNAPVRLERALLVTAADAELKLHDFQSRADADRVVAEFAALLGVPVRQAPQEAGNSGPRMTMSLKEAFSLIRDQWRKSRDQRKG